MSIELHQPRFGLEYKIGSPDAHDWDKMMNPPVISTRELFDKITAAARLVGIPEPVPYEWDIRLPGHWGTDGCLREARFILPDNDMRSDKHKDIGYLVKSRNQYTIGSFEINAYVFSDKGYAIFFQALEEAGLKSGQHHPPRGTRFYSDKKVEEWETRTPLYLGSY